MGELNELDTVIKDLEFCRGAILIYIKTRNKLETLYISSVKVHPFL